MGGVGEIAKVLAPLTAQRILAATAKRGADRTSLMGHTGPSKRRNYVVAPLGPAMVDRHLE